MPGQAAENAAAACAAGQCEKTIGLLEEAVRRQPSDFRLHYDLGLCYGGFCRSHPLVHPDMAAVYLRQALRLTAAGTGWRAVVLEQMGNLAVHGGGPRNAALQAAIECHRESAEIYHALGKQDDWARVQFNLGNSFSELSEITGEDHWRQAISHYGLSLQVRTRDRDPERYAALLENLGAAYRRLPAAQAGPNIRRCIQCYRRALAVYTRRNYPEKNAALQNNLGNAFLSLAETDERTSLSNSRRALRHFDRALRIQSCLPESRAFGITQYNRAQVYLRLARSRPEDYLGAAIACLRAAGAAFQACGEDRYRQLVEHQLERAGRN